MVDPKQLLDRFLADYAGLPDTATASLSLDIGTIRELLTRAARTEVRVVWQGLNKVEEEVGELCQAIGKLAAFPSGEHPDGAGPLQTRFLYEAGDVIGAIRFFVQTHAEK